MKESEISASQFGRVFMEYRNRYLAIADSYVHDKSTAEDIVSDVFTKFWDRRDDIALRNTSFQVYIFSMVRNSCLNYLRDSSRRKILLENLVKEDISSLEIRDASDVFNSEIGQAIVRFLASLPSDRREIYMASRFEGLTHKEIAEKYGYSPRKIRRDIGKAQEELKGILKSYM